MRLSKMNARRFGLALTSVLGCCNAAHALTGPANINIDGGWLGQLELSGGIDGYGYYASGTKSYANAGGTGVGTSSSTGPKATGGDVADAIVELQKTSGLVQFNIQVGAFSPALGLGTRPMQTSVQMFSSGPLFQGDVTIAPPGAPVTVYAGIIPSLEGYEASFDWNNANQFSTDIYQVENAQNLGAGVNYTSGPISATVTFGDGWNTKVFNFLQGALTYSPNANNAATVYFATNLGRTGLNANIYGNAIVPYDQTTVGTFGANYVNSTMVGGYYSYTNGNLNIVPEVQYVTAKADAKLNLLKQSSNFGAAIFENYNFANTPYSLGAWVEYADSVGPDFWYIGPRSELVGVSIAPAWQYKDLFVRPDLGALYLLNNKSFSTASYGNNGRNKFVFTGTLEAGFLF